MANKIEELSPTIAKRFGDGEIVQIYIGKGWNGLVNELDSKLAAINPNYIVLQVKEKFGTLRYYFSAGDSDRADEMYSLVDTYTSMSTNICDVCGKDGTLSCKGGWYATRCSDHEGGNDD